MSRPPSRTLLAHSVQHLGYSPPQPPARQVCLCPHLLGFPPEEVFGGVLRSLAAVGVGPEEVRSMVSSSLAFLISPSASAGVRAALDCLLANGFSTEEVRRY